MATLSLAEAAPLDTRLPVIPGARKHETDRRPPLWIVQLQNPGPPDNPVFVLFKIGGLGSLITSFPLANALMTEFPRSKVVFVTSRENEVLLSKTKLSGSAIYLDVSDGLMPPLRMLDAIRRLRKLRPTHFFDLQIHTRRTLSCLCALLSGAETRIGFYRPGDTIRRRAFDHLAYANMFSPVHELYLQMARSVGCTSEAGGYGDLLTVDRDDRDEAAALSNGWCSSTDRLLIVNPNTSDKAVERRWPIERFAAAVTGIMERRADVRVALIGAAAERPYVERLRRDLRSHGDRVRSFAGRTSLGGLLALLQRADCLLTNDSGPFHFGTALGTPTVGLFGPVHPDHYGRMGDPARTVIFYRPTVCSPCVHLTHAPPCGGKNHCMQLIQPDEVGDACLFLLEEAAGAAQRPRGAWQSPGAPRMVSREGALLGLWGRHPERAASRASRDGAGPAHATRLEGAKGRP